MVLGRPPQRRADLRARSASGCPAATAVCALRVGRGGRPRSRSIPSSDGRRDRPGQGGGRWPPRGDRRGARGSRSRGTHTEHSDWDFAVQTDDFDALARDLPALVETLDPLAAQWEPLGDFPVYMVLVPGPIKIEYLFLHRSQAARPPVTPGADTLVAIDAHFWDWVWWLATKASVGRSDLVAGHMPQLHAYILGPIGADAVPADLGAAIAEYLSCRAELERRFHVKVPRRLGDNVEAGIRRIMS